MKTGLNPEIEQRVARNLDVKGTVADALRIERELRAISDLRRGSSTTSKPIDITVPREICQICYKSGHSANNCKKFNQNSYQNYSRTGRIWETKYLFARFARNVDTTLIRIDFATHRHDEPLTA
ncbi:hypothetical protein P5V15_015753 [Pogonomyrmex californicus]